MNISYNREQLSKMKIPQLKELCIGFNLKKSGKKDILIDRIIQHTSQKHIEKPTPESTVDLEFENKICPAYSAWFSKTIQAKEIISAHAIPTEAFLALGNTLANDSQNEIYEYTDVASIIRFNTDTFGSWGIGEKSLPKETPINKVMEEVFRLKAHVIVKPQNGQWYIKGFKGKKNYQTIKSHLEENQINGYRPKTKTILIKYPDFQQHFSWLSS